MAVAPFSGYGDAATNCTDSVTECEEGTTEYYGFIYVHTSLTIVGTVLNALNLVIFTKGRKRFRSWGSLYVFLVSLSVTDLSIMVVTSPIGVALCLTPSEQSSVRNVYLAYVYLPIANFFATLSVWITTFMTLERYVSVKYVAFRKKFVGRHAKYTVLVMVVCAALLNVPYYFVQYIDTASGDLVYTTFAQSSSFYVYIWIRSLLAKYVPILLIATGNILMLGAIIRTKWRRKTLVSSLSTCQNNVRARAEIKCVSMLVCVSVTFLVCHSLEPIVRPYVIVSIREDDLCVLVTSAYRVLAMFVTVLETWSYASNFIFYFMCNTTIRIALYDILTCRI